jgi:hypothetical protein
MSAEPRKVSIDELEKMLDSDDAPPVTIMPDGRVRDLTEDEIAEQKHQAWLFKDALIARLTEENKLLKSALKTLTHKW